MIDGTKNNLDDVFRVLGQSSSRLPNQEGKPSRFRLYVTIIATIILLTIGIYGIIKWPPQKAIDSPNKGSAISIENTQ